MPLQDVVSVLGPFGVLGAMTLVFLGLFLISLPDGKRSRTDQETTASLSDKNTSETRPTPTVSLPDGEPTKTEPNSTVEARDVSRTDVRRNYSAMPYKEYLQTSHWKRLREEKLSNVGYRCQVCNRGGRILDVHHRTYERLGQELERDLTVLCRACHSFFHERRRLGR